MQKFTNFFRRCSPISAAVNRAQLDHDIAIRFLALVQRMQVVSVDVIRFSQHYLVAMTTSVEKLENEVQIHHLHVDRFHMVRRLRKSVQYVRRYSTKCASF